MLLPAETRECALPIPRCSEIASQDSSADWATRPLPPTDDTVPQPVHGVYKLPGLRDTLYAILKTDADAVHVDDHYLPETLFRRKAYVGGCSCQDNDSLSAGSSLGASIAGLRSTPNKEKVSPSAPSPTVGPDIQQNFAVETVDSQLSSIRVSQRRPKSTTAGPCVLCEPKDNKASTPTQPDQNTQSSGSGHHSLFRYCPHTIRIGPQTHSNKIRQLIYEWRRREGLSLADLIALRFKRSVRRNLYGWAEKARLNNGFKNRHVVKERGRREDHRDCYAETDLRMPDIAMRLAKDHREEVMGRDIKSTKIGKDDLHVAILITLDLDAMIIEELGKDDQPHFDAIPALHQECEEPKLKSTETDSLLSQERDQQRLQVFELERCRANYGELLERNTTSLWQSFSPKREVVVEQGHSVTYSPRSLPTRQKRPASANKQENASRLSSDMEESDDDYRSPNARPPKRQRRAIYVPCRSVAIRHAPSRRSLPPPTPSCTNSWEHVNKIHKANNAGSTSSWADY